MISKNTTLLFLLFSYHPPSTTAYGLGLFTKSTENTVLNTDSPTASLVSSIPTASPVATPSSFVNTTTSPSEIEYDDESDIPTASPIVNTTISPSEFEYDDESDIPTASPVTTTTSPSEYEYDSSEDDEESEDSNSSEDDNDSSEDSNSSEDDNDSCSISCEPGETGLKPYDKCTKFYLCVAGAVKGDPIPCAKGTLFDDKAQFCNWKKNVICPCERNDKPKDDCEPSCEPRENRLKAFDACRKYYSCRNGKFDGKIRTVPDDSLLFDESIQSFNRKEDVKCHVESCAPTMAPAMSPPEERPCCPKGFTGLRPYDECRKYFHCVNGLETGDVLECPRNMLFDARAMSCMWKKKVECVEEDMCERRRLRG